MRIVMMHCEHDRILVLMYWGSTLFASSTGIARNADRACIDSHCFPLDSTESSRKEESLGARTETDAPLKG